jgi:threonyl-tRNA synthetase
LLHSDFVEYEPLSKEIVLAEEEISLVKKLIKNVIVVLTAVENEDDEFVISEASMEIGGYANLVKCQKLLIYPYAHLSSNLASPHLALQLLNSLSKNLSTKFEVERAPFGWTKAFTIKVKGHPLAENSKTISKAQATTTGEIFSNSTSEAIKAEQRQQSSWNILDVSGKLIPLK